MRTAKSREGTVYNKGPVGGRERQWLHHRAGDLDTLQLQTSETQMWVSLGRGGGHQLADRERHSSPRPVQATETLEFLGYSGAAGLGLSPGCSRGDASKAFE